MSNSKSKTKKQTQNTKKQEKIELIKDFDYSIDLNTDDKYISTEFVDNSLYVSRIDREEHDSGDEVNEIIKYNSN